MKLLRERLTASGDVLNYRACPSTRRSGISGEHRQPSDLHISK